MTGETEVLPVPRVAPLDVHETAPALGWYSDHVLFHRIWNRPGLNRRDRSLVTVSALVACAHYAQLRGHLIRALDHGVTPAEIAELVTHLAFYAGWPNAMSSLKVVREVFAERGIPLAQAGQATGSVARLPLVDAPIDSTLPNAFTRALEDNVLEIVDHDVWQRQGLSARDRSIATITLLIAQGVSGEIGREARRGKANGLTNTELCEMVVHLGYYVGRPKVAMAASQLDMLDTEFATHR